MDANITLMLREARIAEGQLHSSHYLKTVTELGDGRKVLAVRDIFSSQGMKLVPQGTQLNSALYQRLLNHKLVPKLDDCLTTEGGVTPEALRDEATYLIGFEESLARMCHTLENDELLLDVLSGITLKPALAFKLTVMHEQRKELFQRNLYVTLVCIYIGLQAGLDERALVSLATAALLHDIGLLHIDPKLLEPSYRMNRDERQHLFAHPITAWLILKDDPDYGGEIAEAVLQHHERLDGSGYPQGLSGDSIGLHGQIISIAEVVASHFGKHHDPLQSVRLETILKLNARRYGRSLIGCLKVFYASESAQSALSDQDRQRLTNHLNRFVDVFQGWESLRTGFSANPLSAFINERMLALKIEALDAGLSLQVQEDGVDRLAGDPETAAQLYVLLDEILFQVHAITREIRRRWPDTEDAGGLYGGTITDWLEKAEDQVPESA